MIENTLPNWTPPTIVPGLVPDQPKSHLGLQGFLGLKSGQTEQMMKTQCDKNNAQSALEATWKKLLAYLQEKLASNLEQVLKNETEFVLCLRGTAAQVEKKAMNQHLVIRACSQSCKCFGIITVWSVYGGLAEAF